MDINKIFILTKYNIDILNYILEFGRPNRSFKSKTAKLIKWALINTNKYFNPIIFKNERKVIFWKDRSEMPLAIYFTYRKHMKSCFYKKWCEK